MIRKKRRKFPIFLAIIILIIVVFGVMLKWNSGYTQSVSENAEVYNKFKDAVISGGTVSLSSDDINGLVSKSFGSQVHRGVTIKSVYINVEQNKLDIKIPVAFKGQNFLVSSRGIVVLKDGCVAYLPDSFKIGAIPLSKNFVLSKLKAMYSSKFTVETDGIYINKSAVPVTIHSIELKDNKLNIGVDKIQLKINKGNAENNSSADNKKINSDLANRLVGEINKAVDKTSDAKAKELLKLISAQVKSQNINSSTIISKYRNLSEFQQLQVQTSLLNNISSEDVKLIRNMFGI